MKMLKASLEKWVDELQAQIDQVKRDVQSIPAPEPPVTAIMETLDIELTSNGTTVSCVINSELMDNTKYNTTMSIHGVIGAATTDDYYVIDITNRHVGDTAARNYPVYYYDADGTITIPAIISLTENYQPNGGVVSMSSFATLGSGGGTAVATLIAMPITESRTKKRKSKK